jgi:hypothetical protein
MLIDTGTKLERQREVNVDRYREKPERQREVNVDRYRDKTRETKGGKC